MGERGRGERAILKKDVDMALLIFLDDEKTALYTE